MRGDGMFGGPMLGFYIHKLDLTDAQHAQVKAIMEKEKPAIQPIMMQMAQGHRSCGTWSSSGNFDETKARELASQQTPAITELMVQYARVGSELVQVLTPEQKTKLTALIASTSSGRCITCRGMTPQPSQTQ